MSQLADGNGNQDRRFEGARVAWYSGGDSDNSNHLIVEKPISRSMPSCLSRSPSRYLGLFHIFWFERNNNPKSSQERLTLP